MDDVELVADCGALGALASAVERFADDVSAIHLGRDAPPGLAGSGLDVAVSRIIDASWAVRDEHAEAVRGHGRRIAASSDGYLAAEADCAHRILAAWR
ncbi:hypothetical protein HT102_10490 [Hoyosella sp. G463]|uniref:Uncharacterized protein n=1 Tax=Lolliginicoccus lacisalsi TaxID=2742202 RepID=A0A927PMW1_9ACTN|nr:hypothetical protein [Lolliginicoccus lacisalsi]MBD8506916.1 hypothetical protein [Lolliginicoccus lacisalsi]